MSSPSSSILVTGANGYLGLHIVNQLLKQGNNVCAAVRSQRAAETIRKNFSQQIDAHQLRIGFINDLTKPECFSDVLDETVIAIVHVASPCPMGKDIKDNESDMLRPAISGTTAVLEAAESYASSRFQRVVQISSFSAMIDKSNGSRPGYVYTEADWNPVTYEEAVAEKDPIALYLASKALAEKAVWQWVDEHKPRFDVVSLCPSMIFGPQIDGIESMATLPSTASLLWQLVDSPNLPPLDFAGVIDVRDAAMMAVAAVDKPEASNKRFLLAQHFDWQSAADAA
ncbi:NAD dependent epimerase dehydratase [Fusarium phyllophilum]|uniref:NAD dependent epimerase dehydratase n=1 Tax=Fusarium phyllophilum TaxID=47803 RepID=A0A8H5IVV7_9HYPO|nr:NAD dependent epimerase dehydratase [Fusarium phyllophilum]